MYIDYASIHNFRCLEDFQILLKPGINLVIGGNATGKTSVMESLATGVAGLVYYLDSANACNVLERDIRASFEKLGSTSFRKEYHTPVTIDTSVVMGEKTYTWRRSRNSELPKTATGMQTLANPVWELDEDAEYEEELQAEIRYEGEKNSIRDWTREVNADPDAIFPLIAYRRARGFMVPEKKSRISFKPMNRTKGYHHALKGEIADIYSWILRMELAGKDGEEPGEYRLFKQTIADAMKKINGTDGEAELSFDQQSMTFLYSNGAECVSLDNASAGHYWLLWLFIDLTVRSLILNPQLQDFSKLEGIVLIDEIDLHLHPRWQWNVLDTLRAIFPAVQFIITTHAPIVIASCKDVHMISLSNDHKVDYPASAYAYSVADVVEYTQGSVGVLPELSDLYNQFDIAYNANDFKKAEALYQILKEKFPNSTETDRAEVKLSFAEY